MGSISLPGGTRGYSALTARSLSPVKRAVSEAVKSKANRRNRWQNFASEFFARLQ